MQQFRIIDYFDKKVTVMNEATTAKTILVSPQKIVNTQV